MWCSSGVSLEVGNVDYAEIVWSFGMLKENEIDKAVFLRTYFTIGPNSVLKLNPIVNLIGFSC